MSFLRKTRAFVTASALVLMLTACAHPELMNPGMTEAAVEEALGAPHVKVVLPDESRRWVYSFQGNGQEVWWVNFDRDGSVTGHEEVLDRQHFSLIKPGVHKEADVWALFGKPAEKTFFHLKNRSAWMYRFKDEKIFNMACWFEFLPDGTVAEVSYTIDPWENDREPFWMR